MTDQELKIKLLEKEIESLRSVISELVQRGSATISMDYLDCYVQWRAVQAFQEVRNHIK